MWAECSEMNECGVCVTRGNVVCEDIGSTALNEITHLGR